MARPIPDKDPIEAQVRGVLERIAADLSMLTDRRVRLDAGVARRCSSKPAASHGVHIAFKLLFDWRGQQLHGALLLPLPEAISLAGYLLMQPEEAVAAKRAQTSLDQATKDAMLEIANFIGGATDGALRLHFPNGLSVRARGCQGLRADQPPAFPFQAGEQLIEGRGTGRIGDSPPFDVLLILPLITEQREPVG